MSEECADLLRGSGSEDLLSEECADHVSRPVIYAMLCERYCRKLSVIGTWI
jgi:hypothetical protein